MAKPLRKIVEVLTWAETPWEPSRVRLECGHVVRAWGVYRARCRHCERESGPPARASRPRY